jgi:HME family heavy-metal exporter
MEVRELADFVIRPQLLNIAGRRAGDPDRRRGAPVPGDPELAALQALDVTHEQVEAAVTRFGTNTGGGFVDQHGREYLIRNVGLTRAWRICATRWCCTARGSRSSCIRSRRSTSRRA